MSALGSREKVIQPEVRGTEYMLYLSDDERLLLARFAYCLCYESSPLHEVLKPLYLQPGYNQAELRVARDVWPSMFGGLYGSNEASTQLMLSELRTKLSVAERVTEGQRQRIEDLIAQNDVLRAEVGKQGEALSRFQMEAPTSEPDPFNAPDDHVAVPRKWKVQVGCSGGGPNTHWVSYPDGEAGHKVGTRSEAYRFKRDRESQPDMEGFYWRVVPLDTPDGIEPDRGYYEVQHFCRLTRDWVPSYNRDVFRVRFEDYASAKERSDYWAKASISNLKYRVKWHSNNA